jgi:hypothetical protein
MRTKRPPEMEGAFCRMERTGISYNGFMVAQILDTELYNSLPRPGIVPRLHLIERLNDGL